MNNEIKLTARDYYKANDPEYIAEHPEVKEALVKIQRNCLPTWCGVCYFGKQHFDDEFYYHGVKCSLDAGVICPDYEGRSKKCPLERGANDEKKQTKTEDTRAGDKH